jgi:AAA domain
MGTTVQIPKGYNITQNILLEKFRIDPTFDLSEPPVYCRISESPVMTSGNFSLILGKAKSGKTFFLGSIVASLLTNSKQLEVISGCLIKNKNTVLYFDTEQSTFHATRSIRRICGLTREPEPINLLAYALRPLPPKERLAAIEELIFQTENLGAVIIDGVRDLLTKGINDEEEATSLTSKFLKWTSDYDMHMILFLHQNKTDQNARGHIGTELLNKAETTLTVTKDIKRNIYVVSCEYSRDIPFEDFAFTIDDGMIRASDLPREELSKAKNPQLINKEKHFEVLDRIFKLEPRMNYYDLQDKIVHGFGNTFGLTASRAFISHYFESGWLSKEREGNKKYYKYESANF